LKQTLFIFILFLSISSIAQDTNTFALIYPNGKSYAPILLPIPNYKSFSKEIQIQDLNEDVANAKIRIYKNGILTKWYSKINTDSIDWKGLDKTFIAVYTNNYNSNRLPLNLAKPFSDSLIRVGKYYFSETDINTNYPYELSIQGLYKTLPDTTGMTFYDKKIISDEYKQELTTAINLTFKDLNAEISVSSILPFQPRIRFWLKDKHFDWQKLSKLNFYSLHKPQIRWRIMRFVILEQ
jgi:hypothetical protein